jgi:crotonobetainyl-CoA:carnitine CoA-transferase CaiB-like acyl-CoA transferase
VPSLIADKTTGMMLCNAVLAALFERTRSGQGQYVEVPMFETMVAFMLAEHLGGLSFARRWAAPVTRGCWPAAASPRPRATASSPAALHRN